MIRIPLVLIAAGTLATSIADTASAQQLVQRRDVSYAVALAIATGAVDTCRALGFTSSAVVVVGRGGDTIIAQRRQRPAARHGGRAPQSLHLAHIRDHHDRLLEGTARPPGAARAGCCCRTSRRSTAACRSNSATT
jgi:hypothetical protein